MTKKKTVSIGNWRAYAVQVSVVIIGVMVTFIGSDLITRWSKAREVKAVMQMLVEELKTNRKELAAICNKLRYDRQGMLLFQHYDMEVGKVPVDSLGKYMFIIASVQVFEPQTDALEVLKTSGIIPSIGDKHLLMNILGSYRRQSGISTMIEYYNQRKLDALNHLFANSPVFRFSSDDPREAWTTMMSDPMCSAFLGTAAYTFGDDDTALNNLLLSVEQTIDALNDKYDFE